MRSSGTQLVAAGLDELASSDFWDEDVRRFYVATEADIYIGVFTPRRDSGWRSSGRSASGATGDTVAY